MDERKSCGLAAAPFWVWNVKKNSTETVDKANLPRGTQDAKNEAVLRFMLLFGAMRVPAAGIMPKTGATLLQRNVRYAIRHKMIGA